MAFLGQMIICNTHRRARIHVGVWVADGKAFEVDFGVHTGSVLINNAFGEGGQVVATFAMNFKNSLKNLNFKI